jgi:hypothetical protein
MGVSWARSGLLALALASLTAMQSPAGQGPPQIGQGAPPPGISVEYLSWGYLTLSWQVAPNGDGEVREIEYLNGFGDNYDMRVRRFQAGPDGFARLRSLLEPVRRFAAAGRQYDCEHYIADGPYGALRWNIDGATGTFPLTYGCMSDEARRLFTEAGQMDELVQQWVRPVTAEVRQVRASAPAQE